MDEFLGIVEDNRFTVLAPPEHCCSVKLTRVSRPAPISENVVRSHEIDLTEYEGKALMVTGDLPAEKAWIYAANVTDEGGPILTAIVQNLFSQK